MTLQYDEEYLLKLRRLLISVAQTPSGLTIGELADRTGIPRGTLRTWEDRYGIPTPRRGTGGHRRYGARDVALVLEIVRNRASGLSMPVAVERAKSQVEQPAQSVFAGLRRRHRDLRVQLLRKPAVLALSRAIEDECCAQADSPLLFASFQRERFYRASEARWKELSRTARSAVVFADFDRPMPFSHRPVEVPVPFAAPLNREWILVCDSPDYPGCVVGWERPGRSNASDRTRGFETLWSVEPRVVREAARMCAALSEQYRPGLSPDQWTPLEVTPPEAAAETRRASGILDRMLTYLSASSEQA